MSLPWNSASDLEGRHEANGQRCQADCLRELKMKIVFRIRLGLYSQAPEGEILNNGQRRQTLAPIEGVLLACQFFLRRQALARIQIGGGKHMR